VPFFNSGIFKKGAGHLARSWDSNPCWCPFQFKHFPKGHCLSLPPSEPKSALAPFFNSDTFKKGTGHLTRSWDSNPRWRPFSVQALSRRALLVLTSLGTQIRIGALFQFRHFQKGRWPSVPLLGLESTLAPFFIPNFQKGRHLQNQSFYSLKSVVDPLTDPLQDKQGWTYWTLLSFYRVQMDRIPPILDIL